MCHSFTTGHSGTCALHENFNSWLSLSSVGWDLLWSTCTQNLVSSSADTKIWKALQNVETEVVWGLGSSRQLTSQTVTRQVWLLVTWQDARPCKSGDKCKQYALQEIWRWMEPWAEASHASHISLSFPCQQQPCYQHRPVFAQLQYSFNTSN